MNLINISEFHNERKADVVNSLMSPLANGEFYREKLSHLYQVKPRLKL